MRSPGARAAPRVRGAVNGVECRERAISGDDLRKLFRRDRTARNGHVKPGGAGPRRLIQVVEPDITEQKRSDRKSVATGSRSNAQAVREEDAARQDLRILEVQHAPCAGMEPAGMTRRGRHQAGEPGSRPGSLGAALRAGRLRVGAARRGLGDHRGLSPALPLLPPPPAARARSAGAHHQRGTGTDPRHRRARKPARALGGRSPDAARHLGAHRVRPQPARPGRRQSVQFDDRRRERGNAHGSR